MMGYHTHGFVIAYQLNAKENHIFTHKDIKRHLFITGNNSKISLQSFLMPTQKTLLTFQKIMLHLTYMKNVPGKNT